MNEKIEEVTIELEAAFEKAYEALGRELNRVRSGRANANMLDVIKVTYYGVPTPINQVAQIQVPEARLIVIKPFDASILKDIERSIQQSDLGLNPNNDGTVIRLSVPALTEDRRKTLVKQVHKVGEEAKQSVRNARRDANSTLKQHESASDITEDDLQRSLKDVQTHTDAATAKIEEIVGAKESDLMEV